MTHQASPLSEDAADAVLQTDRRNAERYACDLQPFWRVAGVNSLDTPRASIHDISATGIGLRVHQELKAGTVLVLTLQGRDQRLSRPLPVRVMHSTALADGDWLVGCQFVRALSGPDLRALLPDE